jgi:hypothetical protein
MASRCEWRRTLSRARFWLTCLLAMLTFALPAAPVRGEPDLRKSLSMTSINEGGDADDLTALDNLELVKRTGARWVRLWIRWDKAQPLPPAFVPWSALDSPVNDLAGCGTGCGYRYIASLDAQIAAARAAGLNVVLVSWLFPRWANGTAARPADWAFEDRGTPGAPLDRLKSMETRVPVGQLGPGGHYGRWIDWLVGRYAGYGRNLALEIMNEPNLQMWPQQAPSPTADPFGPGRPVIGSYIAEMMATARSVSAARGDPILMAAPALSDHFGVDSRAETNFRTAVSDTLAALPPGGWPDNFVWTHHNYIDVEENMASPTRADAVRGLLVDRWDGRGGSADPKLWLTEGGARLGSGDATDPAAQAQLVALNWARMTDAPGIEMWTNYLLHENPVADSGLRENRLGGGAPRPVWNTFAGFPGVQ